MGWMEMPSFCGAKILHSLRQFNKGKKFEPVDVMLSKNFFGFPLRKIPFIIFGDVDGGEDAICGKHYAKVIEENKLGPIWTSSLKRNPNSGNAVNLFVWEVDWVAYEAFAKAKRPLWDTVKAAVKK